MLAVRDLVKDFPVARGWRETLRHPFARRTHRVLDGVTLEVPAGALVSVLGPNGAGKTTLFKVLATLVRPDAGAVTVAGHDAVANPAEARRHLAPVLADERSLFWRLSARENLELWAGLHGSGGAGTQRRIGELLALVGLADAGRRMVGQFSSGMRQRLLIARALVGAPRILLLDEPTRALDPQGARDLRRFVRDELVRGTGCTVLLATHQAEEAFDLADRVIVLHRGRVVAADDARGLHRTYAGTRLRLRVRGDRAAIDTTLRTAERAAASWHDAADGFAEVEVPADTDDRTVHLVSALVHAGVEVAGAWETRLPLAELLDRVEAGRS